MPAGAGGGGGLLLLSFEDYFTCRLTARARPTVFDPLRERSRVLALSRSHALASAGVRIPRRQAFDEPNGIRTRWGRNVLGTNHPVPSFSRAYSPRAHIISASRRG